MFSSDSAVAESGPTWYALLESGSVESLETYQDSMNRSAEEAARAGVFMNTMNTE